MATVKELKRILGEYPPDMVVLLASDEEGNSFGVASDCVGNHVGNFMEFGEPTEVLALYPEGNIDGSLIE